MLLKLYMLINVTWEVLLKPLKGVVPNIKTKSHII